MEEITLEQVKQELMKLTDVSITDRAARVEVFKVLADIILRDAELRGKAAN